MIYKLEISDTDSLNVTHSRCNLQYVLRYFVPIGTHQCTVQFSKTNANKMVLFDLVGYFWTYKIVRTTLLLTQVNHELLNPQKWQYDILSTLPKQLMFSHSQFWKLLLLRWLLCSFFLLVNHFLQIVTCFDICRKKRNKSHLTAVLTGLIPGLSTSTVDRIVIDTYLRFIGSKKVWIRTYVPWNGPGVACPFDRQTDRHKTDHLSFGLKGELKAISGITRVTDTGLPNIIVSMNRFT